MLATPVMKEMVEPVLMLMSVPETHVMIIPYVLTLQVLTNAKNVRLVIVRMDQDVLILTNVHGVLIIVIEMLVAKIQKVVLLAVAMLVTPVMGEPVVISTNVLQGVISVDEMHSVLILMVVIRVLATMVIQVRYLNII